MRTAFADEEFTAQYRLRTRTCEEKNKPLKVLIATSTGGHRAAIEMELVLTASLKVRGVHVMSLLCDGVLSACQMCEPRLFPNVKTFAKHGPIALCESCFLSGKSKYFDLDIESKLYSNYLHMVDYQKIDELLASVSVENIHDYKIGVVPIGEHAKAGTLRYFARGTIPKTEHATNVYKRYFKASLLTYFMINNFLDEEKIDVAVFHHGIYVPQGILTDTFKSRNVRVVNWNVAYRENCFIFSHNNTYHHTLMHEDKRNWEELQWSDTLEDKITTYLEDRRRGTQDWTSFVGDPVFNKEKIIASLGCDAKRPQVLCLSNVIWDAQLHYPENAFKDMIEWVNVTIEYFVERPDLDLIIRIHPAEIRGSVPTRQPLEFEILKKFPKLPKNIFLVKPENNISTYSLAEISNCALIYGTKMGVELAARSLPVIVAGEAWIRNKGLTIDVKDKIEYLLQLEKLPFQKKLTEKQTTLAKKYAYHFFFQRMIPVNCFSRDGKIQPYKFTGSVMDLVEGSDPGLDVICDGITNGAPFVYSLDTAVRKP